MNARRGSAALAAALSIVMTARAARADGTPTQPPGTPTEPPATPAQPSGTPTEPAPAATSRAASGMVHLQVRAYRKRDVARVYVERGQDRWALVCTSPCKVDLPPGAQLRVTLNDEYDEPHDFSLQAEGGRDVDLEVKPASRGALAGGIVMVSLGGVTAIVGLLLFAVSGSGTTSDRSGVRTAGGVCLALGAGLTIGGIMLIANRSHEPRVEQETFDQGAAPTPRRAAWAEDAPKSEVPLPPVVATPLGFRVAF